MTQESNTPGPNDPRVPARGAMIWLLIMVFVAMFFYLVVPNKQKVKRIPFKPNFTELVEQGRVRSVVIVNDGPQNQYIKGELTETDAANKHQQYRVDLVLSDDILQWLRSHPNIPSIDTKPSNPYVRDLVGTLVPFIVLFALVYFLFIRQMRNAGKGAMSFGKSRAKLLTRNRNRITFADVAGAIEAKDELVEVVDFLKDPKRFQKLGGRIPKGVLLVGPPKTGKTLLAKAIAGEADVPFFSISGSDFVEMFVGVGASRVRDMFEQGKKSAPCIIFIDEIDAVGRSRFSGIGGGHDEREQTLNALLVEMDGFDTQEGVIIIAATNRADVLDNALLRPGRFDRQIMVDLPNMDGREAILKIHVAKISLAEHVDLRRVARGTPGFSGADLANLVNEAALLAARRGAESVEMKDMEEARDKVRFGAERRSRVLDETERRLTAYHEAGHAIVMEELADCEPVHKVTIIPRGQALGATMQLPEKDRYSHTRGQLQSMLVALMGGRAAEEIVFKEITTGASNDLKHATAISRAMVCDYGMNERMGPRSYGRNEEHLFLGRDLTKTESYSESTAQAIDEEINRMLREAHDQAVDILNRRRTEMDTMAEMLLERETIDGQEVREIVKYNKILNRDEREKLEPQALIPAPSKAPPLPVGAKVNPLPTEGNGVPHPKPGYSAPPETSPA